jgi:hypothetical protein
MKVGGGDRSCVQAQLQLRQCGEAVFGALWPPAYLWVSDVGGLASCSLSFSGMTDCRVHKALGAPCCCRSQTDCCMIQRAPEARNHSVP